MKKKRRRSPKSMSRRDFFQTASKGALALGCFSIGLSEVCKSEKPTERVVEEKEKISTIDMARVSTCSIALNHLSADKAFEIIADAGHKKVDPHEKVHLLIFEDLVDPVELKATADKHGLQIANLATYPGGGLYGREFMYSFHDWKVPYQERYTSTGFASDDPEELKTEMEQVKKTIDLAAFLGARSIRVFPGDDKPESLDKMVPWFKRAAEYAAEKNVYMAFENEGTEGEVIVGTPDLCVELAEKVGSPYFGVLYEPGNLTFGGTDYRRALEIMKNNVVHTHFKDCASVSDGYEMRHFGEGIIDFPWIVEQLNAVGYDGDFSLEYEMHDPEPEIGIEKFHDDFAALFDEVLNM